MHTDRGGPGGLRLAKLFEVPAPATWDLIKIENCFFFGGPVVCMGIITHNPYITCPYTQLMFQKKIVFAN